MPASERSRRTAGLDGLRAIAALSVLCLHVWLYTRPDPDRPTRSGFFDFAMFELRLGLVFFFVLSGYLLYRTFAAAALRGDARVSTRRYARRRLARIVPAYYVALAGAIALLWGSRGEPGVRLPDVAHLPLFLVFGQNYSHETLLRLNPVLWTLALEAAFYVALPLIGLAAFRFARGRVRAQAALLLALAVLGFAWSALDYHNGWGPTAGKALFAYLPHFACGMLVALWMEARRAPASGAPLTAAGTAALVLGGFALAIGDGVWHATAATPAGNPLLSILGDAPAAAGFALVVAAVAAGRGSTIGWTRARPLAWVGLVSYGVYLWHVPMILFARAHGLLPSDFAPALAVMLPPVLLVSAASWYGVERPLIGWADRRPRRARGARAGTPTVRVGPERDDVAHPDTSRGEPALEGHAAP